MPQNNENSDDDSINEIVVTGKSQMSAEPRLVIDFGGGGSNVPPSDFNDWLPESLRALLVGRTDFDVAGAFSTQHRAIVRALLKGLSEHPRYAAKFAELMTKGADVNIRYATTADFQNPAIGDVDGAVQRQGDGPIRQGEVITIIVREKRGGEPVSNRYFASALMEELMHLFADSELDNELDNSRLEDHVLDEIFGKNYNFDAPFPPAPDFLESASSGGTVTAGPTAAILSGSSASDTLHASIAGGGIFPGAGDDTVHVKVGGQPIIVADDGGVDTLVIEGDATIADVRIVKAADRDDIVVMVHNLPLVYIKKVSSSGAFEYIDVGNVRHSMASIPVHQNTSPVASEIHQDVFGDFYGGFIVYATAHDDNADQIKYELKEISGDFANADWRVDPANGAISCFMTKYDEQGSKFTSLVVRASDGVSTTDVKVTIRWAHSQETHPEL